MKKLLSLASVFTFLLSAASYGQQQVQKITLTPEQKAARQQYFERKADSAIASREVVRMKQNFAITPQQEQALLQAGVTISNNRRNVFKSYWKTDGFHAQMLKVDSAADVLYGSIVGAANYKLYKEALHTRMIQRQQMMQQQHRTDSLNRSKTPQP